MRVERNRLSRTDRSFLGHQRERHTSDLLLLCMDSIYLYSSVCQMLSSQRFFPHYYLVAKEKWSFHSLEGKCYWPYAVEKSYNNPIIYSFLAYTVLYNCI